MYGMYFSFVVFVLHFIATYLGGGIIVTISLHTCVIFNKCIQTYAKIPTVDNIVLLYVFLCKMVFIEALVLIAILRYSYKSSVYNCIFECFYAGFLT